MRALSIYAGRAARQAIERSGLAPQDISVVPGAAGGPKGLILGPLDRFIFGRWLTQSDQPVHLVGSSIGAWRMAVACLDDPVAAFSQLEDDYIHQHYALRPGERWPPAHRVSELFGQSLQDFFGGRVNQALDHRRYRLHIITSHGRHILGREQRWRTPVGFMGAYASNLARRNAMGAWLERVVFSTQNADLPFSDGHYRTRRVALNDANFHPALQASCSIPFVLQAVHDIPGAPRGAYWDGGLTDYHLHLDYRPHSIATDLIVGDASGTGDRGQKGLVLYPHFQNTVVPGWFDKHLTWRHRSTPFLDNVVLLAPNPDWVKTLPNGKLPDRSDFARYGQDLAARVKAWSAAVTSSAQLAEELESWLERPDLGQVADL